MLFSNMSLFLVLPRLKIMKIFFKLINQILFDFHPMKQQVYLYLIDNSFHHDKFCLKLFLPYSRRRARELAPLHEKGVLVIVTSSSDTEQSDVRTTCKMKTVWVYFSCLLANEVKGISIVNHDNNDVIKADGIRGNLI